MRSAIPGSISICPSISRRCLLRAGDHRSFDIVRSVAALATPTGQWPEAIHPRTKGGCMGDGQHVWASAEWVMIMRNMFVREEQAEGLLILCSGIPQEWLKPGGDPLVRAGLYALRRALPDCRGDGRIYADQLAGRLARHSAPDRNTAAWL